MKSYLRLALFLLCGVALFGAFSLAARKNTTAGNGEAGTVLCGAARIDSYLSLIRGKKVAVVANPTSRIGDKHLVDRLLEEKVRLTTVFAPEHGFRGEAGAGDRILDGKDPKTGVKIISLYGKKHRPAEEDLDGIEVVLFDIQDVGVRFYTYISTLQYVMEACADFGIPVIVLDRPNPNGHYVDGPVLDTAFRSFVGRCPVPVVHGCTVGEYAKMLVGEGWLETRRPCQLTVIPMEGYTHNSHYSLPVRPSPNLPNMNAVYLYPSLCLFEGTRVSVGRGTAFPFEVYGFPGFTAADIRFTPVSIKGVAMHPPYEDSLCDGKDLRKAVSTNSDAPTLLQLAYLLETYSDYPEKRNYFIPFFDRLAGTDALRKQIMNGTTEQEIRDSWQQQLAAYKLIRKKYLLYPDFE